MPFSPADTRMELLSRASILLLEPIPESRFTRTFHELYRLQKRAVPCIREGEAASESLATAIDGGYQVELLGKLALGRESRPVTAGPALIGWRSGHKRKNRDIRESPETSSVQTVIHSMRRGMAKQ